MKLSEILDQVDTLVPNALQASMKITWINQIQNQMYRDYFNMEAVHVFKTVKDQAAYILPLDCPADRIRTLVINNKPYDYVPVTSDGDPSANKRFFTTVVSGDIFISPTPDAVYSGVLYYRPRPLQLTETNLNLEPTFPTDFHEMLVFGCASRVAKVSPDTIQLATMYENDFQRLAAKADQLLRRNARQKTVRNVRSYWGG